MVSNGLFTVTLDFGAAVFDGSDLWLEIGVRTDGKADFEIMSPRQQITLTPLAMSATKIAVTSGYWALPVAVQTEGAPTLMIATAGGGQITVRGRRHPPIGCCRRA